MLILFLLLLFIIGLYWVQSRRDSKIAWVCCYMVVSLSLISFLVYNFIEPQKLIWVFFIFLFGGFSYMFIVGWNKVSNTPMEKRITVYFRHSIYKPVDYKAFLNFVGYLYIFTLIDGLLIVFLSPFKNILWVSELRGASVVMFIVLLAVSTIFFCNCLPKMILDIGGKLVKKKRIKK